MVGPDVMIVMTWAMEYPNDSFGAVLKDFASGLIWPYLVPALYLLIATQATSKSYHIVSWGRAYD